MRRILRRLSRIGKPDLASVIIQSTLLSEQLGEKLKTLPQISRTRSFGSITGLRVVGKLVLIDLKKTSGVIEDLIIKGPSSDFRLHVRLDDEDLFENTFSELSSLSDQLTSLSAFQEDSTFIIHLSGLGFRESAFVVIVTKDLSFTSLYALVEVF